ncbi:MAG: peptidylprolyl isomerase [Methylacidiphilales bacterium]|nr:peptidylprolyl isomerase [Candidatus Methylacidiphilales bacterium]
MSGIGGLALVVLLAAGCDHHKPGPTASDASSGAVTQDDSSLTGLPPGSNNSSTSYPRAKLVSLPTPTPTSVIESVPVKEDASMAAANPPSEPSPTPEPTPAETEVASTPPMAAPSPTPAESDGDMPRLEASAAHPTVAATPAPVSEEDQEQVVVLQTSLGTMVIELDDKAAPKTCENFRKLVSDGFYNHTTFHRVIPHFIIQGGDPNSRGTDRSSFGQGGPGYTLPAEISLGHNSGAVAMARLPDSVNPKRESNGSQFYICLVPCPTLDDQYTVFGHVIKGMDVAAKIGEQPRDERDNPLQRVEMQANLEPKKKALTDSGD